MRTGGQRSSGQAEARQAPDAGNHRLASGGRAAARPHGAKYTDRLRVPQRLPPMVLVSQRCRAVGCFGQSRKRGGHHNWQRKECLGRTDSPPFPTALALNTPPTTTVNLMVSGAGWGGKGGSTSDLSWLRKPVVNVNGALRLYCYPFPPLFSLAGPCVRRHPLCSPWTVQSDTQISGKCGS